MKENFDLRLNKVLILSLATVFFTQPFNGNAQNTVESLKFYNWFDSIIGLENSYVFNGEKFSQSYASRNKEKQFLTPDDDLGTLIYYDGQPYAQLDVKYDVLNDNLLLNVNNGQWKGIIVLVKSKIDSFYLSQRKFIKIEYFSNHLELEGFFETVTEEKSIGVYKKLSQTIAKVYIDRKKFYKFKQRRNKYFLLFQNTYYQIGNKADLIKIFPIFKKEINNYYDRTLHKSDKEKSFKLLASRINQLILNSENYIQE